MSVARKARIKKQGRGFPKFSVLVLIYPGIRKQADNRIVIIKKSLAIFPSLLTPHSPLLTSKKTVPLPKAIGRKNRGATYFAPKGLSGSILPLPVTAAAVAPTGPVGRSVCRSPVFFALPPPRRSHLTGALLGHVSALLFRISALYVPIICVFFLFVKVFFAANGDYPLTIRLSSVMIEKTVAEGDFSC